MAADLKTKGELTLSDAGLLWLRRAEVEALEESTVRQYRQHLRLHIDPFFGGCQVDSLGPPTVESFKDHLLQTRSRAMAKKVMTSLKGILNEAVRLGYLDRSPADCVKLRVYSRRAGASLCSPIEGGTIPTKAEIRALLKASEQLFELPPANGQRSWHTSGTWWHAFFVVALFTGMRASELRGLTWDHVDLRRQVIHIRQRADFKSRLGLPKSAAAHRNIPMAPLVHKVLAQWQASCPPTEMKLVFPSRNGRIQTNSNIHKMCWGPLQLAVGLSELRRKSDGHMVQRPRLTFHALRHTAASLFIEHGWLPKKIQTVLGHSSIHVTFDIYGKLWSDLEGDLTAMASLERQLLQAFESV